MLSPRRPAGGDRRQCHGRQADPGFLSQNFRSCSEPAARCRRGAPSLLGDGEGDRRRPQHRTSCRRFYQDRGREHGERDQEDFSAAGLRCDPLRAQLLRRRRRPARLPGGRCARHGERADPSAVVTVVGLRHGPRRYPQRAPTGHRGAVRRQSAQDVADRVTPAGARDRRRGHRPRRRDEQNHGACAGAYSLRRNRHAADRRCGQGCQARIVAKHEIRLRACAQSAVRLHRSRQGAGHRGSLGRGDRRRCDVSGKNAQDHADQTARAGAAHAFFLQRKMAARAGLYARHAGAGSQGQWPGHHHRAASDRCRRARLAGRAHRQGSPCAAAGAKTQAHARHRHSRRSGDARSVQQPVHVDRRADGRGAAEHRLFGEHQGAARFLLRGVRRHRLAGCQCAAHAGASRLDGPCRRDHHPRKQGQDTPRQRLRHQRAV